MNKKVSALVVAFGVVTTPIFAKEANRYQQQQEFSENHSHAKTTKRLANAFKRLTLKKVEKEYLKETEAEITQALKFKKMMTKKNSTKMEKENKVIHKDKVPNRGIDLTAYVNPLSLKNSS